LADGIHQADGGNSEQQNESKSNRLSKSLVSTNNIRKRLPSR